MKPERPARDVLVFAEKAFKEVIKLKYGRQGG